MNLRTLYDIFLNFVFNKIFKIKNLSHPLMMVSAFGLYLGSEMVKYRKGTISSNEWITYFNFNLLRMGPAQIVLWIENLSSGLYLGHCWWLAWWKCLQWNDNSWLFCQRHFSLYLACKWTRLLLLVSSKIVPRKKKKKTGDLLHRYFSFYPASACMYVGHYWWSPWWKMSPYCDNTAACTLFLVVFYKWYRQMFYGYICILFATWWGMCWSWSTVVPSLGFQYLYHINIWRCDIIDAQDSCGSVAAIHHRQ